jgi:hypothetical protein
MGEVAASWGRTWVKWQPHGDRTWEHNWGALQAAEIMENMEEKVPHYVLKIGDHG